MSPAFVVQGEASPGEWIDAHSFAEHADAERSYKALLALAPNEKWRLTRREPLPDGCVYTILDGAR